MSDMDFAKAHDSAMRALGSETARYRKEIARLKEEVARLVGQRKSMQRETDAALTRLERERDEAREYMLKHGQQEQRCTEEAMALAREAAGLLEEMKEFVGLEMWRKIKAWLDANKALLEGEK